MHPPRLSGCILVFLEIAFLRSISVLATRGLRGPALRLSLPQMQGIRVTTTTTTTTDVGPYYLLVSSSTTKSIYSWNSHSGQASVLVPFAGSNPYGIALDHNLGYVYYSDPGGRQIVRYQLAIRNGEVQMYDDQPVIIAQDVDSEWLTVNDYSNLFWTDPVDHSIKKMYFDTIDKIAAGTFQPDQLHITSYMDIYLKLGRAVPSYCYSQKVFPSNCTANITCNACKNLHNHAYIYKLFTDMGHPSGMQVRPGNKLLWGNLVDGFTRGTVVEAQAEPILLPGATSFSIRALSYLWDSVFNFIKLPDSNIGQGTLFLTTNGTLGVPPIPGDVTGAVVAITPATPAGPEEAIVLDWNLDRPRSLAWNGHEKLYIADESGVRIINSGMLNVGLQGALETRILDMPGAAGIIHLTNSDPCYPLLIERGLEPYPNHFR